MPKQAFPGLIENLQLQLQLERLPFSLVNPYPFSGSEGLDNMKAILQRVLSASVTVDKQLISSIGKGILVFAAVANGDTEKDVDALAAKLLKMRLWDDEAGGRWKMSVQDIRGEVLCVSQFTLLASTKKGSKPDFHGAVGGDQARSLYQRFVSQVQQGYEAERVKDGVFQAMMEVALVNDGPVTIEISTGPSGVKPSLEKKDTPKS